MQALDELNPRHLLTIRFFTKPVKPASSQPQCLKARVLSYFQGAHTISNNNRPYCGFPHNFWSYHISLMELMSLSVCYFHIHFHLILTIDVNEMKFWKKWSLKLQMM